MAFRYTVRTDKDVEFTGAIAQNASEEENVVLPVTLKGINGNARIRLKGMHIISDENLDWEVWLFGNDLFQESNIDNDRFLGRWSFVAADGLRIAGTGAYYYAIDGLDVEYVDLDNSGEIHVALVNRSAAGKTAGAAGEIVIEFVFEVPQP